MVAGLEPQQSIILSEQAANDPPSFDGWATAVGAFAADTGESKQPDTQLTSSSTTSSPGTKTNSRSHRARAHCATNRGTCAPLSGAPPGHKSRKRGV